MSTSLSVIMPVYNQQDFIAKTIESVLSQTYKDFEFLILDDGSTDGTRSIIEAYASKDKRIKAFYEENTGKCNSTNKLVNKSQGEWCVFLDADDLMISERLEKQLSFHLNNKEVDASSCHCYYIDYNDKIMGKQRYPFLKNIDDITKIKSNNEIILCAFTGLMLNRKCYLDIGGLNNKYWPCEDVEFANRLIDKGYKLLIIQEFLMKYRIHNNSVTNSNLKFSYSVMNDFVNHCIKLRRSEQSEIELIEFVNLRKKDSWVKKIKRTCAYYSKYYHREAGFSIYTKNYVKFLGNIMIALLLDPMFILASFKNKLKYKAL